MERTPEPSPVFSFESYKSFLSSRIPRGTRNAFAAAIQCQPSFVSQVLHGSPNLSLEQGIRACEHLKLSAAETDHFMILLHLARSGTQRLKNYFDSQRARSAQRQNTPSGRIEAQSMDDAARRTAYYTDRILPALHVLLSVPTEKQAKFLQDTLQLTPTELKAALRKLRSIGLVESREGRWLPTERRLHLPANDELIYPYHLNARGLSLQRLARSLGPKELRFTSYFAVSRSDSMRIKEKLLDCIAAVESVIRPSPEEEGSLLSIDLHQL